MSETAPQQQPATIIMSPPSSAFQLGGQSLNQVTAALAASPMLLVIVVLNITFAGIAGYFMLQLESYRAANLTLMIELVRSCVLETAPLGANRDKIDQLERDVNALQNKQMDEPGN